MLFENSEELPNGGIFIVFFPLFDRTLVLVHTV